MAESWSARRTESAGASDGFSRPDSGRSMVGVLTPAHSDAPFSQTRIDQVELVIGRGEPSDGVNLQIQDENVSRKHARVCRLGDQFVIEDLDSRNGTFVDGVPVKHALLHDGDTVQIGKNAIYFDQLFEFAPQRGDTEKSMSMRDWFSDRQSVDGENEMSLRFWGTRGSLPTPGAETRKYGGNTTCVEVRFGKTIIVLDAGSGIREMSKSWIDEFGDDPIAASLCFTHLHWDHIQGFPFFGAAYQPKNTIQIYGARRQAGTTKELLSAQMEGDYFPIPLSAMKANLDFHETKKKFSIADVEIETFDLPHPSGSLGYRFSAGDSVFVMATDSEVDQVALNRDELEKDFTATRQYQPGFLSPMRDADLLLIDCQYADEEYKVKTGWGHNSLAAVVDLCRQVRPKMVALSHHDPVSNDATVSNRVKEASDRLRGFGINDILVFGGRERLAISVQTPKCPMVVADK